MSQTLKKIFPAVLAVMLQFIAASAAFSQSGTHTKMTPQGASTLYFWQYLPPGYDAAKPGGYPIIIFLHGNGKRAPVNGEGFAALDLVTQEGLPEEIKLGANMCFRVNGVEKCFIVLSPQLPSESQESDWNPHASNMIKYAIASLNEDPNRIYVTGLSLGGRGTIDLAQSNPPQYGADLIAATAVAPGGGANTGSTDACLFADRDIPIWAVHSASDPTPGTNYGNMSALITAINACTTPELTPDAHLTTIPGSAHDVWTNFYKTDSSKYFPNVYEWFLLNPKTASNTHPLVPGVDAGGNQTVSGTTANLSGAAGDNEGGSIATYKWSKTSGPSSVAFANDAQLNTTVSNLMPGVYSFRLTVTDNASPANTQYDEVKVTVLQGSQQNLTVKINFRSPSAPPSSGTEWNDFTTIGLNGTLTGLRYSNGGASNYAVTVVDGFNGTNSAGETTGIYPAEVMQTAWFVTSPGIGSIKISGLDNAKKYSLKFFGSRDDATTKDRTTVYSVDALSDQLNASNNTSEVADLLNLSPANGEITFTVADVAGGEVYGYLNAMEIVESVVETSTTIKVNFRSATAAASPGSEWNDFTTSGPGDTFLGLKYSDGRNSVYSLTVTDGFNGKNAAGETVGVYPAEVMQTAWFVTSPGIGAIKISGLDDTKTYSLKFFASRDDATALDRTTVYSVGTFTDQLNASSNKTEFADIPNLSPTNGEIIFTVADAAGGEQYGYLNALEIIESSGAGAFASMAEPEAMTTSSEREAFSVHPMPYTNNITITFEEAIIGNVAITVKDVYGKIHYQKKDYQISEGTAIEIDLSNTDIPRGMGVIKIQSSKGYSKTVHVFRE